ncbi:hypothetical protein HMJ29_12055 [Hymenobacter taeanensis]|uniref:Uncharacterized protein n=1 Tax=Hymenobacter taeanensis TaxID=2735321 RepID=A0A6M6BHR7_9BACT|nr:MULTISPECIES: hypothetical protein [Hymenobacter]QJX47636.1 hypothetical protein HMJ29_12055 [Hymenobacter taeanensis]UOQ82881.1 hypothetical protein MUN83_09020 [Hymenobacter sp. 5414T-23]
MNTCKLTRDVKFLKTYALATTILPLAVLLCAFSKPDKPVHFGEISVERLNLVERDGTVKMLLSNKARFPQGVTIDGKHIDYKREHPGMLFYNDKGEECGGLIFGGEKDANGNVSAGSHLSLDRFGQDQVIALNYQEQGGGYKAGLTFSDAPDESMTTVEEKYKNATAEQRQQAIKEGKLGLMRRVYVGTTAGRSSAMIMADQRGETRMMLVANTEQSTLDFKDNQGRTRLTIGVDKNNQPVLRFLNEQGKEVKAQGL